MVVISLLNLGLAVMIATTKRSIEMKLSDKFKYMIVGAVIALTGFGVGSLVTGIDAQSQVGIFDTVTVFDA